VKLNLPSNYGSLKTGDIGGKIRLLVMFAAVEFEVAFIIY
jgi:hypothetical protein